MSKLWLNIINFLTVLPCGIFFFMTLAQIGSHRHLSLVFQNILKEFMVNYCIFQFNHANEKKTALRGFAAMTQTLSASLTITHTLPLLYFILLSWTALCFPSNSKPIIICLYINQTHTVVSLPSRLILPQSRWPCCSACWVPWRARRHGPPSAPLQQSRPRWSPVGQTSPSGCSRTPWSCWTTWSAGRWCSDWTAAEEIRVAFQSINK